VSLEVKQNGSASRFRIRHTCFVHHGYRPGDDHLWATEGDESSNRSVKRTVEVNLQEKMMNLIAVNSHGIALLSEILP
jgi:hypothetical protein